MAELDSLEEGGYEILSIFFTSEWGVDIRLSFGVLITISVSLIIFGIIRFILHGSPFGGELEIESAEIGAGDSKITLKPNMADKGVAYKIWVELSTRKIGLPIDLDHDVISEIYDSWYEFFSITRELIKDIPVSKVRNRSTKDIINLSINVLNLGLRPHLTKWQARFRRWYDREIAHDPSAELHPQDIQRKFPDYDQLVADMMEVNGKLMKYREKMDVLVHF